MARYLGIDFGQKRVGIAISDPTLTIAQPHSTIKYFSLKKLVIEIINLTKTYDINKIIVGLPLNLKGKDSIKTEEVRQFANLIKSHTDIPVMLFDERLTTVEVQKLLIQFGKKPSKSRNIIDQLAAQRILQTYIDREKR